MSHLTPRRTAALLAACLLVGGTVFAAPPDKKSTPLPRAAVLRTDAWQNAPPTPVKPAEIDALVLTELKTTGAAPAPRTTDEQFLRRVTLDLIGELPTPADLQAFVADTAPDKRARRIDKLLASEEFAKHWARYWREVIAAKLTDRRGQALARPFEVWMTEQLHKNRSWGAITRDLLTASGSCKFDDDGKNGALYFLLSRTGAEADNDRAAETARIFMGIQIQCAQCHDHPSDVWKRQQFHDLAGYFARSRDRFLRDGQRLVGIELVSLPFREHPMPSKEDPKRSTPTPARFLDGKAPRPNLPDADRRRALADAVVSKDNYWFSAAFVNRTWNELMGQAFYTPIDDMGPEKEAVFPTVLTRLAASFRASDYDIKELFRTITNSETYQRQSRLGDSTDEHLHFAASYPRRLSAEALWQSLVGALGALSQPGPMGRPVPPPGAGPRRPGGFGLEAIFKEEFRFDPSLKVDEVEDSIPQALLLMNNPLLNQRMQARGDTVLARILRDHDSDDAALRALYQRVLARKPTDREKDKCRNYIARVGRRAEAFEDILWALVNSTEFQTRR